MGASSGLGATGKLFAGGSQHGFYQTESGFYLGALVGTSVQLSLGSFGRWWS